MDIGLDSLRPSMAAEVRSVNCRPELRKRLADFGLVEGTHVECCYRSPDGGVTALRLRGTCIAVRTCDLRHIRASRL